MFQLGLQNKIQINFQSYAPTLAYHQRDQKSCCFIILASVFVLSKYLVAANAIATPILELMAYEVHDYSYIINF